MIPLQKTQVQVSKSDITQNHGGALDAGDSHPQHKQLVKVTPAGDVNNTRRIVSNGSDGARYRDLLQVLPIADAISMYLVWAVRRNTNDALIDGRTG